MIKVIIVEDHDFYAKALEKMLNGQEDMQILMTFSNGLDFIQYLKAGKEIPDIVLMDIKLPKLSGAETTKLAIDHHPAISVITITMYAEQLYLHEMIAAGAKGFILKSQDEKKIVEAIHKVYKNEFYFSDISKKII
jgi:DNA-binding NarL/FixJ family response regulator